MALQDDDAATQTRTFRELTPEVSAFDAVLFHLNHGCAELNRAKHDHGPNLAAVLLLGRAWNSLWRARVDATTGYYVQALALCRTAYEDWGVLEYLDAVPADARLWLKGITFEAADFNTLTFAKIWPVVEQRVAGAGKLYGELCSVSHPTGVSLRWTMEEGEDPDAWSIRAGPSFDREDARHVLHYLLSVALQLFTPIERLHRAMLGGFHSQWRAEAQPIIETACDVLGVRSPWAKPAEVPP